MAAPAARAQVTFSAPAQCGTQEEFLAEVRALQRTEAAPVRVTSVVIREVTSGGYELELEGPDGSRVLTDGECRTLFRSAVVIAAAAGGNAPESALPEAASLPPTDTNPPTQPASPPPAPTESALAPAVPAQPPASSPQSALPPAPTAAPGAATPADEPVSRSGSASDYRLSIAGGGGVATGLSPDAALLLELAAALGFEAWGGALVLKYLPASSATTDGNLGLELQTIGARLGVFYALFSVLRVQAGLAVYRLTARGMGISHPTTDSVWMAAPEVEAMFVARLSRAWALELGPQGRVGLTQPTFQVEPETEVFQLPRFGAALVFRVQWGSE